MSVEHFLIDPPIPVPEGLDLVNKPQVWQDPTTKVYHLLIWIGEQHYPHVSDYIEETRRYGASRKVSPLLDVEKLTPGTSRMILAHPRCRNTLWQDMALPARCVKRGCRCARCREHVTTQPHDTHAVGVQAVERVTVPAGALAVEQRRAEPARPEPQGPCLGKCYELIPVSDGTPLAIELDPADAAGVDGELLTRLYQRSIADGATVYTYSPTGETAKGLEAGLFAALPLHGFDLITYGDGTLDERQQVLRDKLERVEGWAINEEES